jgi:hypothetical protein
MMKFTKRTLVALTGLATLAASAGATISITPLDSSVSVTLQNEASILPNQLSGGVPGAGTITPDTGSFLVSSTTGLTQLEVGEVSGLAMDGTLTLTVLLDGTTVLYSDSTSTDNPLTTSHAVALGSLTGVHTVSYSATWTGNGSESVGYLGGFTVDAFEAVPEPASVAVMGVGVIGLLARRRRSSK